MYKNIRPISRIAPALLLAAAGAACAEPETSAREKSAQATTAQETATPRNGAAIYLADLPLVDADGNTVDLYRDLIQGHSVVIHSFFARCEGSCPVMMSTLQSLQKRLGGHLGREVRIVSITVDPKHDGQAELAAYARRVQAGPGWYFLGGSEQQVSTALRRIGQYTDAPQDHMNLIIVGNDRSGDWRKLHGLAPARDVVAGILEAIALPD
ncbi:SCO family protein [Tahibacter sp. P2K]|uniref:SCO family protein n=1 Tax=Tahibacter harae TaxID=2963937 RepID=A0ABT1QL68_9GAMM|nr:SCO family protein [Tahibacter harae]